MDSRQLLVMKHQRARFKMAAMRGGLQYRPATMWEIPNFPRHLVDLDETYLPTFTKTVLEWIEDNCEGEVYLRVNADGDIPIASFASLSDLTLFKITFA